MIGKYNEHLFLEKNSIKQISKSILLHNNNAIQYLYNNISTRKRESVISDLMCHIFQCTLNMQRPHKDNQPENILTKLVKQNCLNKRSRQIQWSSFDTNYQHNVTIIRAKTIRKQCLLVMFI